MNLTWKKANTLTSKSINQKYTLRRKIFSNQLTPSWQQQQQQKEQREKKSSGGKNGFQSL